MRGFVNQVFGPTEVSSIRVFLSGFCSSGMLFIGVFPHDGFILQGFSVFFLQNMIYESLDSFRDSSVYQMKL